MRREGLIFKSNIISKLRTKKKSCFKLKREGKSKQTIDIFVGLKSPPHQPQKVQKKQTSLSYLKGTFGPGGKCHAPCNDYKDCPYPACPTCQVMWCRGCDGQQPGLPNKDTDHKTCGNCMPQTQKPSGEWGNQPIKRCVNPFDILGMQPAPTNRPTTKKTQG